MKNFDELIKDNEFRKYAYNFDTHIMHYYFIETFKHWFVGENCLEIGSNDGEFTQRLAHYFTDITCVEPSTEAINKAKLNLNIHFPGIDFINDIFENAKIEKHSTIIVNHILEHIENPVSFLIKALELLDEYGILIICVPNANAPSRQIAVKMGLIPNNIAITEGEKKHGHYRTYTFDTLEKDVKAAGLNIIHRGGIFFKCLANFQWDRMIKENIITPEYLDGCYQLGQQYPELCSSIYLICKK